MENEQKNYIFWKISRSFSFSLRKTSLAVKIQGLHFKSRTYFSNKAVSDNCKHWSAFPLLSLSLFSIKFLQHTPRNEKQRFLAAWWEFVIEIFILSERANWQIPMDLCHAGAELDRHAAGGRQPQLSLGPQDSSTRRRKLLWNRGKWEAIYFNWFHALLQKPG